MMPKTYHLFIPSLLSPLKTWQQHYEFNAQAPELAKKLCNTTLNRFPALPWLQQACLLLAPHHSNGSYAEQLYHAHFHQPCERAVLCAAPISMTAGMSDIMVGDFVIEDIDSEQQQRLLQELNSHFSQDGWVFKVSPLGTWFLLLDKAQKPLNTVALNDALGASLRDLMEGKIEVSWGKQLNELQMLLFNSPVNQQRELAHKAPVQSFWLWDFESKMLTKAPRLHADFIHNGGKLAKQLAQHANLTFQEDTKNIPDQSGIIIFDDLIKAAQINDVESWQQHLSRIEKEIMPLIESKNFNVILYTDTGHSWNLSKPHFWSKLGFKREKQLIDLI